MKFSILIYLFCYLFCLKALAAPFQAETNILSGAFTTESHPADADKIRVISGQVQFVQNETWVAYPGFDFGSGVTYLWIEATSGSSGGTIELRVGAEDGDIIGTVPITNTGGWGVFKPFGATLPQTVSGVQDLYLRFVGGGGFLFDLRSFRFQRIAAGLKKKGSNLHAAAFDLESNPGSDPITPNGNGIESITAGSWIAFEGYDFGDGANTLTIEGATPGKGGTVEVRLGSPAGSLVGSADIFYTGSWTHYRPFTSVLSNTPRGVHDLYLKFIDSRGTGGNLFNLRDFILRRETPGLVLPDLDNSDMDKMPAIFEYALGMNPFSKEEVPFTMSSPDAVSTGFQVRLRAAAGLKTTLQVSDDLILWNDISLSFNDGIWQTDSADVTVSEATKGDDGMYSISLEDTRTHVRLFARLGVETVEGDIHVYPPVPGLDPSPHYTFSVQKVSALNAGAKENATNWENPFPWFTRCVDYDPVNNSAYYDEFIGGWSHTYTNFEMDAHTPIVVKISRLNPSGAPSGPISSATAHPAHKVISCEVINGEVYVTMDQPALVAIDIDGQMDNRLAPRATETGFGSTAFPYRNALDGCHGVTIFANPFIKDKPTPGDPGVFVVQPGTLPPVDGSWNTLYFAPGIHKLSVDASGNEREWQISDPQLLKNGKSYYIPGDAIVYGNFNDLDDNEDSSNIRVFGHGTISGTKIPHWRDFVGGELPEEHQKKLRMLHLTKSRGCTYEGITVADPAEHGIYIQGPDEDSAPNIIKWVKNISWRVNNDGGGVTGNGYVEDCFFRHQDDALYIRGVAIRRCVLWSDVNGAPLRCSFITNDLDEDFPRTMPQDLIVEDIDVIYSRGVFAGPDSTTFGVIATPGRFGGSKFFADGTPNTAQHVIFRNIRITDPKPMRPLLGFDALGDVLNPQIGDWAGLRFENIEYRYPQVWGWKNRLLGSNDAAIRYWTFDQVKIGGQTLDASMFTNPLQFETGFVSDMIFK